MVVFNSIQIEKTIKYEVILHKFNMDSPLYYPVIYSIGYRKKDKPYNTMDLGIPYSSSLNNSYYSNETTLPGLHFTFIKNEKIQNGSINNILNILNNGINEEIEFDAKIYFAINLTDIFKFPSNRTHVFRFDNDISGVTYREFFFGITYSIDLRPEKLRIGFFTTFNVEYLYYLYDGDMEIRKKVFNRTYEIFRTIFKEIFPDASLIVVDAKDLMDEINQPFAKFLFDQLKKEGKLPLQWGW